MIGKPEWFKRRKYGGWGVSPKTWQGGVYLALVLIPFIVFQALPYWSIQTRMVFTVIWVLFLIIDIFDIMVRLKKDEREKIHEAFAERNALWVMMLVLIIGVLYQLISSGLRQTIEIDWFIIVALFLGLIVKSVSNIYLDKRN